MGSLMWSKSSTHDWKWVKDNKIWELEEINVVPASLKLSYDNLLSYLKRCFAYCCLFPKGYEMEKDMVIELRVINGFIPARGGNHLYVLGEQIFNCLVWRSFFQVVENKFRDDTYKMHDLMHDMAQHVMGDDCFVTDSNKDVIIPEKVLHLSSSHSNFLFLPERIGKLTSLRSVFMSRERLDMFEHKYHEVQISNNVYLRVLHLWGIRIGALPKSVYKLKHLKYLNLSYLRIEVLSESIMYLQNLQVLLLKGCRKLPEFPEGLRFMSNINHLDIIDCQFVMYLPLGIKEICSLRILKWFPVGKESEAKIEELDGLNLLQGELQVDSTTRKNPFNDAHCAS